MSKFTHTAESRPLDGYTIKRPLHRGGFGEVYFAVTDGGRDVAMKLLQHNVDVELRGVQQCLNLSHPNLVTIFDVKQDGDGDHWIIMEFVPGETLDDLLRRENRPLPMQEVLRWMRGLCAGVGHMHDRGIVHRDLKPSNIFGAEGIVKVGDIGLSKFITASRRSAHTESVGTVYYMAPEISRGRYGKEVDIYALGIIAYEMLTGNVPFDGESAGEILMKHLTQPPNLSALPERLRPVIHHALAKDPHHRPQSVSAFLKEFEAAVVGRGASARVPPVAEVVEQPTLRTTSGTGENDNFLGLNIPLRDVLIAGAILCCPVALIATAVSGNTSILEFYFGVVVFGGIVYQHKMKEKAKRLAEKPPELKKGPLEERLATAAASLPPVPQPQPVIASQDVWLRDEPVRRAPVRPVSVPRAPTPWYGHWSVLAAIGVLIVYTLRGRVMPVPLLAMIGGTALVFVTRKTFQFGAEVFRGLSGSPPRPRQSPLRPVANSPLVPVRSPRERLSSLTSAACLAPLSVTALTGAMSFVQPDVLELHTGNLSLATVFVTVATIGAWMISLVSTMAEDQSWDKWTRRGMFGAGGLVTGSAAYAVWTSLFSPGSALLNSNGQDSIFSHFGSHSLITDIHTPTLAGFLCFFGFFFALVNWTKQTDPLRKSRLGLWPLLASMLLAMATSQVLEFSVVMASLWAAVISCTVQVTSPLLVKQAA